MLVYICVISSLVCFILYVIDRRMRDEPIDWLTAFKVSLVGALLSGGGGYAFGGDLTQVAEVKEAVQAVQAAIPQEVAQEMFVGIPTF